MLLTTKYIKKEITVLIRLMTLKLKPTITKEKKSEIPCFFIFFENGGHKFFKK